MSSIISDLLIVFILILGNALFVMSEMAIVSSRKARLQQKSDRGDESAKIALELSNSPSSFLPTVQIGITLITILSGAFGETTISRMLIPILANIPHLSLYKETIATIFAILIITYLSLVIGELVPKRLALNNPESLAKIVAIPIKTLSVLTAPFVYLLSISTDLILRLLHTKPSNEPQVTEEEIKVLIEQGTEAGTVEQVEQEILERVFKLGDRQVSNLMTPRPDIVWLDLNDSGEANKQKLIESSYSRLPVCQNGLDNVIGIMMVTDLLSHTLAGLPLDLTKGLRRPLFVPENMHGLKVLEVFKQTSTHIAIVVDEYGVIQGLVTLNDILVEIVGDIPSVEQDDEPQAVQREDGSWLLDGMLPVEEFLELFKIEEPQDRNYQTVAGFVITQLGRIPTAADHFEWKGLRVEVVDMDGNRVDKVLVMLMSDSDYCIDNSA